MKPSEGQLRGIEADDPEAVPAQAADPAIGISLALETPLVDGQVRKLGDRARRHQGHGDAFAARVEAGDVRGTGEENVSFRAQRVFTNDHLVALEIRQGEEIAEFRQLRKGKPGQSMDATQPVEVGIASRFVSFLQVASKLRQAPREKPSVPDFTRKDKPDVIESTALQFFREP